MTTRVVITGIGAVTNLGQDAPSTWAAMREGKSGISHYNKETEAFAKYKDTWHVTIAGEIKDFDPTKFPYSGLDAREARRIDEFSQFGCVAAGEAVQRSGIDFAKLDSERCGIVIGSGIGGIQTIEDGVMDMRDRAPDRLSPFTVPRLMVNACAGHVSMRFGLRGPSGAHATACASSGHAIADAVTFIRKGYADVMLAGGAEAAVAPLCVAAFMTMKALSTRNNDPTKASRPFDKDRDGFVLAEGAAMMVLESEAHAKKRGATILAEIVGCGNSSDAYHITAPDPNGSGATRSMRWALQDAKLNPTDIDYVNAHGTSTPLGDRAEVAAAFAIFGDHAKKSKGGKMLMSSTKSMHGHALGASGAIESLACIHAVRDGIIAPTINLDNPEPEFDLDLVPHHARERRIKYAMNNTFGFGGHNVSLVFGRYE